MHVWPPWYRCSLILNTAACWDTLQPCENPECSLLSRDLKRLVFFGLRSLVCRGRESKWTGRWPAIRSRPGVVDDEWSSAVPMLNCTHNRRSSLESYCRDVK